ncbi:MAG: hypothetical protein ACFFAN_17845 [Promethearchaeota archaeon]
MRRKKRKGKTDMANKYRLKGITKFSAKNGSFLKMEPIEFEKLDKKVKEESKGFKKIK